MSMTVKVYGLDVLLGKVSRYGAGMKPALERTTKDAVIYVHSKMPKYPPPPAGSTYRRTMTLWRTITSFAGLVPDALSRVETLFAEVRGIIGTKLKYAPWVIDEDNQTEAHASNGWWTLQDVVRKLRPGIVKVYEKGIRDYTRSIFP